MDDLLKSRFGYRSLPSLLIQRYLVCLDRHCSVTSSRVLAVARQFKELGVSRQIVEWEAELLRLEPQEPTALTWKQLHDAEATHNVAQLLDLLERYASDQAVVTTILKTLRRLVHDNNRLRRWIVTCDGIRVLGRVMREWSNKDSTAVAQQAAVVLLTLPTATPSEDTTIGHVDRFGIDHDMNVAPVQGTVELSIVRLLVEGGFFTSLTELVELQQKQDAENQQDDDEVAWYERTLAAQQIPLTCARFTNDRSPLPDVLTRTKFWYLRTCVASLWKDSNLTKDTLGAFVKR